MVSRLIAPILLLSCGLARADGGQTELVPSCADIDAQRDTFSPDLRKRAVERLTRVLEREDLLVVTSGCVDRYVVSHERDGDALVLRIAGPHGIRRMRGVSVDTLDEMYARMVVSLLAPMPPALTARPAPEPSKATDDATHEDGDENDDADDDADDDVDDDDDDDDTEDRDASVETAALESDTESDPVIDAVAPDEVQVAPDRILYGQFAVGSVGGGWGLGYRRHAAEHVAMDVSFVGVSSDMKSAIAFGVEALYVQRPRETFTPYIGGGLSFAGEEQGAMSGAGPRAELTAGISFARAGSTRWFSQVDLALPMFTLEDDSGRSTYRPSVSFSLGLGF